MCLRSRTDIHVQQRNSHWFFTVWTRTCRAIMRVLNGDYVFMALWKRMPVFFNSMFVIFNKLDILKMKCSDKKPNFVMFIPTPNQSFKTKLITRLYTRHIFLNVLISSSSAHLLFYFILYNFICLGPWQCFLFVIVICVYVYVNWTVSV